MAYTTIEDPTKFFNTLLYAGNGGTQSITGVGFQPDWVWLKDRTAGNSHKLYDGVRGATKYLISDTTSADATQSNGLTSFDSDGFTLGSYGGTNNSSNNYVSWNWLAGGSASSNSDGDITSSVSANTTAGFSIVSYTGTGSNATIGHGLGVAPAFMMIKNRGAAQGWCIYHHKNTSAPQTDFLSINSTDATVDASDRWNDTAPTSSVFSVGNHADTNGGSATYIGYFFNEVKGYSKFGSYAGNGNADGIFVYTGFKPAWVMQKSSSVSGTGWHILDTKRSSSNPNFLDISANSSNAEYSGSGYRDIDFLSNGFKIRVSAADLNKSGASYIYMAFAESPFVNSNGIPNNAR